MIRMPIVLVALLIVRLVGLLDSLMEILMSDQLIIAVEAFPSDRQ